MFPGFLSFAQPTSSIDGSVTSIDQAILPYATVILKSETDSVFIRYTLTNQTGQFRFDQLSHSTYWVEVRYIGFSSYSSEKFFVQPGDNTQLPPIQLTPQPGELEAVEIQGKRSLIVLHPDKLVLNVANTIYASSLNALEVLRKSPGVVITNNDEIRLAGTQGVAVYVDDKPIPLNGKNLTSYLQTLSASEIERVEIITNPSAKYDANGSGGILNIILKKGKKPGFNASVALEYSAGKNPWYDGSLSTHFRNSVLNIYGSYSHNSGVSVSHSEVDRQQESLLLQQSNDVRSLWNSNNVKGGIDFFLSKAAVLGFQFQHFFTYYDWTSNGRSPVSSTTSLSPDRLFISRYEIDGQRKNLNFNANFKASGKKGSQLKLDVDYGRYQNPNYTYQPNIFLDSLGQNVLSHRFYENDRNTEVDLWAIKGDHELKLGSGQLSTGAKLTYSDTHNRFDFFDVSRFREWDIDRSQQFAYSEDILALYTSYQHSFDKLTMVLGMRMEDTRSAGKLRALKPETHSDVTRHYISWFPSAGLSLAVGQKNSFQLNYSRRISRPSFNNLNPFLNPLDELTFEAGNPYLLPEYTQKLQLTHAFNYQVYTSIGLNYTRDRIIRMRERIDEEKSIFRLYNLASQRNLYVSVSASLSLTKWWSTYNNFMVYQLRNEADLGFDKAIEEKATSVYAFSQHTFTLPGKVMLEIYGWYNSPSLSNGNTRSRSIWSMDAGIRKKLWQDRGSLSLSITDVFYSNRWNNTAIFDGITVISRGYWDSRRLNLSLSYLLGNKSLKKTRLKQGLEEESQRLDMNQEKKKG